MKKSSTPPHKILNKKQTKLYLTEGRLKYSTEGEIKIKKIRKFMILLIIVIFFSIPYVSAENITDSNDIGPNNINIEAPDVTMYYKNSSKLNVELSDSDMNPISNNNITININGVNYIKTTDLDGKASLNINLNPGKYLANIYFLGNDEYLKGNTSTGVEVLSTIVSTDLTKYYKSNSQFETKLLDNKGNALINETVTFNVNGIFYNRSTNSNGIAKLNINLHSGKYTISTFNPKDGLIKSNKIKVLSSINSSDLKKIYKDSNQYWATFRYENGEILKNTDVKFNVNGVSYTRKTDNNGTATLNINLPSGEYIITAHNPINNEKFSNKIYVYDFSNTTLKSENKVFKENEEILIKANLTNRLNQVMPNEIIILTTENNTYTTLTNKNGEATFDLDLPQGNYTLTFNYAGDETHGASQIKTNLEVHDGIISKINANNTCIFNNELFNITLTDEKGNPLVNKSVYCEFDSKTVSAKTNENGIAGIKVSSFNGEYNVKYYFNETYYKYSKGFAHVTVLKLNKTIITPLTFDVLENNKEKLYVQLKSDIIPLSNRTITVTINGKTYQKITNDKGIANITINLPEKHYNISYFFKGDDRLKNCTNSSILNVCKDIIPTKLTPLTKEDIYKNTNVYYKVLLSSEGGNPINAKKITLTIGSNQYTSFTKNDGIAEFNIIKDLDIGNYTISTEFGGDERYGECKTESREKINPPIDLGYGYWLIGYDIYDVNLSSLATLGTKDLLINYYAITRYGEKNVSEWAKKASKYGIRVHILMQVLYKEEKWTYKEEKWTYKYDLINSKIDEAKYYANISGIAGIHFDHLRYGATAYKYPTAAESINYFVERVVPEIKKINPNCLVTAAAMPEPDRIVYYYGQDIPTLSKYLDAIIPITYKGIFDKDSQWIGEITQRFIQMSNGAQIWTGLQTFTANEDIAGQIYDAYLNGIPLNISDKDAIPLSYDEMFNDAQLSLNSNSNGVILFRIGLTNFLDFNKLIYI